MTPDELKKDILEKTAEYCRLVHGAKATEPFTPGKSRVNYAGRVFDEKEMQKMTDFLKLIPVEVFIDDDGDLIEDDEEDVEDEEAEEEA